MWQRMRRLISIIAVEAVLGAIIAGIVILTAALSLQTFTFAYQGF